MFLNFFKKNKVGGGVNIFKQKTIKKANEVLRNEQDVNIENYNEVQRTISQPIK